MKDYSARIWTRLSGLVALLNVFASSSGQAAGARATLSTAPYIPTNPVLLIHGIHDSAASMQTMNRWLTKEGREVHTVSLAPNDGTLPLPELARQVATYVRRTFSPDRKIDLVGFSMGGIVSRYYIQRLGGVKRVERFVCVSAPNHGSWLAFMSNHPGCVQMRPGSAFLQELNAGLGAFQHVRLTTIWTPLDLTILPARSSRMPVGTEVRKWVVAHPLMVLQPGCLHAVSVALADGTKVSG